MLCKLIREFEDYCQLMLHGGIELARISRAAHGSHISSAMHEPSLSQHLLVKLHQTRSNNVRVFVPPEGKTGGDLEIHVKLPGARWIGLIIQAKRVNLSASDTYYVPEIGYRYGAQYKELIKFAVSSNMLPLYIFYLPTEAVGDLTNRSGAMICNADALRWAIGDQNFEFSQIVSFSRKLSTFFCCLDNGREQEFVRKLEKIFYKKTTGYMPVGIGQQSPPEYIKNFINTGIVPQLWLRSEFAGAAVIDLDKS